MLLRLGGREGSPQPLETNAGITFEGASGDFRIAIENDLGPLSGFTEIASSVVDPTIRFEPFVVVSSHELPNTCGFRRLFSLRFHGLSRQAVSELG